jgi:hypothetical protein
LKIFVSYSRSDGGDFAHQIHESLVEEHDIFTDVDDIRAGEIWSDTIEKNISNCDIFVVIVTHAALRSPKVEREVLQAQRENKKIIPCIHRDVSYNEIKWNLYKIQGIEFFDKYELARNLYRNIFHRIIENYKNYKEESQTTSQPLSSPFSSKQTVNDVETRNIEGTTPLGTINDTKVIQSRTFYIDRYPYARFPDKVIIDKVIPLEVIIKSARPLSQLFKTFTSIKLKVGNKNHREIPVQVIVDCNDDGFEIIGKYYTTINVPIEIKDSKPIIFNIKSKTEGIHSIQINFFQQDTFVGEIKIESIVISKKANSFSKPHPKIQKWKSNQKFPNNIIPGPDITLYIREINSLQYDVLLFESDVIHEMGPIKFQFDPETKFQKIFEEIENPGTFSITKVDNEIKDIGMSLYDELFPEKLKELYWEKRDKIKSVRVISKEPWIPWEILKPWRQLENGVGEEDDFLCERYAFSRWIGKTEKFKEKIKSIKVVVPDDINLGAAIKERDWIEEFARSKNIKISFDSTYYQIKHTLETEKEIDILHFSTHGQNNKESPLLSAIELEGNMQLRPKNLVGKAVTFGQSRPIVILNACQTGN